ncbi:putative mitochondrial protein [Trifolium repens]|nr:putative mitochondrial protein [Trifolium repens]
MLQKQSMLTETFHKLLSNKVRFNLTIPSPWCLSQSIESLFELVHLSVASSLIPQWLIYIHILSQLTMQECTFHIKLKHTPTVMSSQR